MVYYTSNNIHVLHPQKPYSHPTPHSVRPRPHKSLNLEPKLLCCGQVGLHLRDNELDPELSGLRNFGVSGLWQFRV